MNLRGYFANSVTLRHGVFLNRSKGDDQKGEPIVYNIALKLKIA
jgi:hypothetical protein